MFLIWLGELITEHGIGNGISLIIFAGIIARLPTYLSTSLITGNIATPLILAVGVIVVVAVIIFMQEGQRRIPVQYAKRVIRGRQTEGQSTFIPLRVNSAGMIPLIFALSIVYTPSIIASYVSLSTNTAVRDAALWVEGVFSQTSNVYWIVYFVLVLAFTYFYTDITFQQQKLAENLQKYGGFIPGYRPGKATNDYLRYVLNRITLAGAVFLGVVAILPWIARLVTTDQNLALSSTALLIVVAVVLDTMKQLQAQLLMRRYESFIR
jgi:preprotein translocase subunit SecY